MTLPADVLDFWFGAPPLAARKAWFEKNDAFDAGLRQRFGPLIDAAVAGEDLGPGWTDAADDASGAAPTTPLATLLLLDQFTRNAYRGTARAFAGDMRAQALARSLVARGSDLALPPVQRLFVYLPYEHAEGLAAQDDAVRLIGALLAEDASQQSTFDYAIRHRDVIRRFGRFPHRNAALGRASTAAELAFLQTPGSGF